MKNAFLAKYPIILLFFFLLSLISCTEEDFKGSKSNDEQELSNLRNELQKISDQVACTNASDWRIVPIGAKPCGGASSFIAYSINIDAVEFLKKVEVYNNKQKAFNVKWGMSSDCAVIVGPKSITCENGKPKLNF
ncbi:hypothetical protein [Pedobacter aquatilis]|uniref:hypothetical protein n=1 Tax=Pedobacter aquatilis TaxID=351343 RepID=UPI002931A362|nr:hypothetical protein [Pedobacter aquatilis]